MRNPKHSFCPSHRGGRSDADQQHQNRGCAFLSNFAERSLLRSRNNFLFADIAHYNSSIVILPFV